MEETTSILNRLHYLFTKSDGKFVAHCLDLDLASSGKTIQEAMERLNACVEQQIVSCYQEKNYSQLFSQAPDLYWEDFDKAKEMPPSVLQINIKAPATAKRAIQFIPPERLELEAALCSA